MPEKYNSLIKFIEDKTGIILNDRNYVRLIGLLDEIIAESSATELNTKLKSSSFDTELWQEIIQILTIGETYFYRNKNHINALRNKILPAIIEEAKQRTFKQIRIWSAGCATGEEPYSIAMLLHELIPDIDDWSITILATDINEAYLAFAKNGIYGKRSFRGETEKQIINRWFKPEGKQYQISRSIKRLVTFATLNLVSDKFPSYANHTTNFDMIICRNVTIYFDKTTTQRVVNNFYEALNMNGWLLVGHSEPNLETYKIFQTHNLDYAVAYRKTAKTIEREVKTPTPPKKPTPTKSYSYIKKLETSTHPAMPNRPKAPEPPEAQNNSSSNLKNAQIAADKRDWNKALQYLVKAEAENNLNPVVHYLRGVIFMESGNFEDARNALRQSIYCDADFAMAHYMLGDVFMRMSDLKKAHHHWNLAKKSANSLKEMQVPHSNGMSVGMMVNLIEYRQQSNPLK